MYNIIEKKMYLQSNIYIYKIKKTREKNVAPGHVHVHE